jgi:hypothetical protein
MPKLIDRYKAWAALLGQQLADHNIIVTCLDYRCPFRLFIRAFLLAASKILNFVSYMTWLMSCNL